MKIQTALVFALSAATAAAQLNTIVCPNDEKCKAKEAQLCLWERGFADDVTKNDEIDLDVEQFLLFNCAEDRTKGAKPIGFGSILCSEVQNGNLGAALCNAQLSIKTCKSKYIEWSNMATSFFIPSDNNVFDKSFATTITGAKGHFGKPENIMGFHVDPYNGNNGYQAIITLSYKMKGWDPTCYYKNAKSYLYPHDWN
jgi:hypothetical protein